jgi:hypothetical protein
MKIDTISFYEPKMEDFYTGFEFELLLPNCWQKGKFPELLDEHPELRQYNDSLMKAAHAITRVPYLTQNILSQELRSYNIGQDNYSFKKQTYFKPYWLMGIQVSKVQISYSTTKMVIIEFEMGGKFEKVYQGSCRCINDFRTIYKLLSIEE